jgi:carboxylesterase
VSSTDVVVDPSPFDLPGARGDAVLCLHGLTGTPYEVRPLGQAFSAAGIRAVGPALPGHGQTPEVLARVGYTAWLDAARDAVAALRREHDRVCVAGLSMGGLVSLALAAEGAVDAAVVVGTPLRLRQPLPLLIPLAKYVWPFARKRVGSDIRNPAARARHPSYDVMPLAAVHELIRLQQRVRRELGRIRIPILVAHGAHDITADPADSKEIFDSVGSEQREIHLYPRSGHVVPVDYDGPELARDAAHFLREVLAGT